ncbi:WEB family protein At3g02930, chloroplastic-like [Cornus florida]|uniref:WEB family protein At3g02930, chloroplastic-like n=1 Tax=Cornus florida TaxID=4283 RepID=UPI002896B395|nr:WEB family protein At3g02930, chloroplastic-like [Cornus florida]XP_059625106.1 WEB family protein At3g02930, chloroplastic-like [Cornus florida]
MSSKSKSTLSESSNSKASPATPRVSKLSRGVAKSDIDSPSKLSRGVAKSDTDSPASLQNPRHSVDRSPRSVISKPAVDRRSPKLSTPPDKQPTRVLKGSELQAQLGLAQEELKKAKEKVILVEKEKAQAIEELKEAQKLAEESNEKLREALVAQKRAEENSEIEKFRAVEMEQAGIEVAQKKEEEWQKEFESVRNQHALDVSALLSATQELQRLKQELAMTCDAKNQALSHADDATKIAEIHAEKVEILSAEVVKLKALLDSKREMEADKNNKLVSELSSEIETLKQELEEAKCFEDKLMEKEDLLEKLNVEMEAAKMAESYARNLVEEWKKRVEELETRAEEANRLERSASESLESIMKQLEGSNDLLHDAESEIAALKEKVGLLEISMRRQKGELEESERRFDVAKEEASEMEKRVDSLQSQLETLKEEKIQALNNEKLAATSVQTLLEEKNKLINDLESSRDEEDRSKKAMESLASALHEVSSEAREAKEKLLSVQAEHESYETQIENLKLVLKATNEKYETMLDDVKHENDVLINSIEQSKHEYQNSKAEWEQKELHLVNCIKQSEEENTSMEKEVKRLLNMLKEVEEEACATKEEGSQLKNTLKEAESEVIYLKEVLGEAKAESLRLKESLLDKGNELDCVIQENEELRSREAASFKKVEELSKLLEEAMARKKAEENGELTDSEKDYDMLPKVVEFSEQNGDGREEKHKLELPPQQSELPVKENSQEERGVLSNEAVQTGTGKGEDINGTLKENESKEKEVDDAVEVDFKMWETCKIGEKDFSPEREPEPESFEEELDSKVDAGENYDQMNGLSLTENIDNGGNSPSKQQSQKKKKPLLRKFGSLLKKKGTSNQK